MNILFVYSLQDAGSPKKPLQTQEQMAFGISYISSYLKKSGHNTRLLIMTRETKKAEIDVCLKLFCPEVVCFTAVATEYNFIVGIAGYIKERQPQAFLIIGGVHVSLNPCEAIEKCFDAVCIGEGERATLQLVDQIEKGVTPSGISNLWIKHGDQVEKNRTMPFLNEIDRLPFPDRDMWQEWIKNPGSRYSILLGRGCPFQCTYCCNHALKKLSKGPYVRFRTAQNIVAELEETTHKFPKIREVYLETETFGANIDWAINLCSALRKFNKKTDKAFSYGVNLRITRKGECEALFAALGRSNFRYVNIGLESGSERVRREILKRDYSNDDIVRAVNLARKNGLKVGFYNMLGIPGETIDDFNETVGINRICLPDFHYLSIFYPYPGTDLFSLCRDQGLILDSNPTEMERCKAILDLPGFSKKQVQKRFIWFDYYAFKGHRPLYKILAKAFVNKFHSNYHSNRFYRRFVGIYGFNWLKELFKGY